MGFFKNQFRNNKTGKFGHKIQSEAQFNLVAPAGQTDLEYACELLGIDQATVASSAIDDMAIWLTLKEPHPTGGYTRVVHLSGAQGTQTIYDVEPDSPFTFPTRHLHRLDGPAVIEGGKERWFRDGVEVPAPARA